MDSEQCGDRLISGHRLPNNKRRQLCNGTTNLKTNNFFKVSDAPKKEMLVNLVLNKLKDQLLVVFMVVGAVV